MVGYKGQVITSCKFLFHEENDFGKRDDQPIVFKKQLPTPRSNANSSSFKYKHLTISKTRTPNESTNFWDIPDLFSVCVMSGFLSLCDVMNCELVCKDWYCLINGKFEGEESDGMWNLFFDSTIGDRRNQFKLGTVVTKENILTIRSLIQIEIPSDKLDKLADFYSIKTKMVFDIPTQLTCNTRNQDIWQLVTPSQWLHNGIDGSFCVKRILLVEKFFVPWDCNVDIMIEVENNSDELIPWYKKFFFVKGDISGNIDSTFCLTSPFDSKSPLSNSYRYDSLKLERFSDSVSDCKSVHHAFQSAYRNTFERVKDPLIEIIVNTTISDWLWTCCESGIIQSSETVLFHIMKTMFYLCNGHFWDGHDIEYSTSPQCQFSKEEELKNLVERLKEETPHSHCHQCYIKVANYCSGQMRAHQHYFTYLLLLLPPPDRRDNTPFHFITICYMTSIKRGRYLS